MSIQEIGRGADVVSHKGLLGQVHVGEVQVPAGLQPLLLRLSLSSAGAPGLVQRGEGQASHDGQQRH